MSKIENLNAIRESIDKLDKEILELISSRAALAKKAGKEKITKEKKHV